MKMIIISYDFKKFEHCKSNRLVYIYTDTKIKLMVCITYVFPSLVKVLEAWLSEHPPLVGSLSQSERHSFSPGEVVDEKSTAPR